MLNLCFPPAALLGKGEKWLHKGEVSCTPNIGPPRIQEEHDVLSTQHREEGREALSHAGNMAGHAACSSSGDVVPHLLPTARDIDESVKRQDEKTQNGS